MFDHDRSATRGEMATRRLIVFRHATVLGNAPAHALFDRVRIWRHHHGERVPIGDAQLEQVAPARSFANYEITIDREAWPALVDIIEPC